MKIILFILAGITITGIYLFIRYASKTIDKAAEREKYFDD